MSRASVFTCFAFIGIFALCVQGQGSTEQLSSPRLSERAQRALFPVANDPFKITANTVGNIVAANRVENAGGLQQQADRTAFPILATLPNGGSSFFLTSLKPCALILPHVHMRATETYIQISGTQTAGLAEENGGRQNVTFTVGPGQAFLVPQGLLHYNANKGCTPIVFIQSFSNSDAGTISVTNALAALKNVDNSSVSASNAGSVTISPQGAFGLDQACLASCGLSSTGGDLSGLSNEMKAFMGVGATAPASGPSTGVGASGPARGPTAGSSG